MCKSWSDFIKKQSKMPYYQKIKAILKEETNKYIIYPEKEKIFEAFKLTPLHKVKVVIIGQDPYINEKQAHGLSFSIDNNCSLFPPSLKNIFLELKNDLNIQRSNKNLSDWAKQGVLLLNTILTVRAKQSLSHQNIGWEIFTDNCIELINNNCKFVVFVCWGLFAQKKIPLINQQKHFVIRSAHPSPFSANRGFLNSKPFSKINYLLRENKLEEIRW